MKPEAISRTERILGATVQDWATVTGRGYSIVAERWLVALADGATAFVKTTADERYAGLLRDEYRIYSTVRGDFLPRLLGWDDGRLPVLVLEDLSQQGVWPPPWSAAHVDSVLEALELIAATPPPAGLPRMGIDETTGWYDVEADPEPFLGLGLCSRAWLTASLPRLLEASGERTLAGQALIHFDVRSDNLCIRGGKAVLFDWNAASVGNPALDLAFWLPSLELEGGPTVAEMARDHPSVNTLAAFVAGFFAARAGLPAPSGAPTVRPFQLAQLELALPWTVRALGLPELDSA